MTPSGLRWSSPGGGPACLCLFVFSPEERIYLAASQRLLWRQRHAEFCAGARQPGAASKDIIGIMYET